MRLAHKIALFVWFYVGWFACVYMAKSGLSPWSLVIPLLPFLAFIKFKIYTPAQLMFLLAVATVGSLFDWFLAFFSFIQFENHVGPLIPTWLVALWLLFTTVFFLSHDFFKNRLWLAGLLGAIFGPLSYLSGEAFQVLKFTHPSTTFIYAAFWALFFPGLHYISRKLSWK